MADATPFPARYFTAEIRIDAEKEYARLKDQLRLFEKARDADELRRALDKVAHDARQAQKLYLLAKEQYDLFVKIDQPKAEAIMRRTALASLEQMREKGEIKKAPTEAMIEDFMIRNLPEWEEVQRKHVELGMIRDDLRCFAEMWDGRRADLRKMCELHMMNANKYEPERPDDNTRV
jgi:hypothetical protein